MEKKDYIVNRKDIYVGEVIRANGIYRRITTGNDVAGCLDVKKSNIYRNILFTPTKDKYAYDLLYDTTNYPILNGADSSYILANCDGSILVRDYYNLDELLEYFCYDDKLNISDIIKIYNTFFTGSFSFENPELFGRKRIEADEIEYYKENKIVTDCKSLERCKKEYKKLQEKGKGLYSKLDDSVLDRYYFIILQRNKKSFIPSKEEGKVKKLVRF